MRVKKPVVCEAKTLRAGKSHTSLYKLKHFIRLCGGQLGPGWQRDKETRRYIPPEGFRATAGTRSKIFYQTRTEVAEAMGLHPVPIPQVPKEPTKRTSAPGTEQTAAREPDLQTPGTIGDAAANQQPKQKVRNTIMSSFHEGKQIAKLEQCLKNEGLNLQPGWAAERRIRSNGCQYVIFYHAPPGIAAGQGSTKAPAFKSVLEVVRAHKMALQLKTTPQQTSAPHSRAEHACAGAGMQSGGATDTRSSRTAYGQAAHIPPAQPGEIIVLSDSDTDSPDKEDAVVHGQSGAGILAAAASAAATEGPAVQSSWQAAIEAAILRGCSMQIPSPHLKRRRQ